MPDVLERRTATPGPVGTSPARPAGSRSSRGWLGLLAIGLVALVLRLVRTRESYDIFIDEPTYADIARSVAAGEGLLLHGEPFILHPPGGLLLLGGAARLSGHSDLVELVFDLRTVSAVLGAAVAVVITLLLRAGGLRRAAVAGGLLVALDPFAISFDGRVMLEAIAQSAAALTMVCAVLLARSSRRTVWTLLLATAVAGSLTFSVKETFGLVVLGTLVLAGLVAGQPARRHLLRAAAGTVAGYALVNVVVVAWVGPAQWWDSRFEGLTRLVGLYQPTGFNAPEAGTSLWSRVGPNALEYGLTYVLLVGGGLSGVALFVGARRRWPAPMPAAVVVLASWTVVACGYVGYAVLFGSIEEQMFYIALAPCVASLVTAVGRLAARGAGQRVAVAGLVLVLLGQAAVWAHVRTTPDDVHDQLLAWLPSHVPADSTIAATDEVSEFLITQHRLGQWSSLEELEGNDVDYVVLSENLVAQGYGFATPEFERQVRTHGDLVFSADGRRSDLRVYDVRAITEERQ